MILESRAALAADHAEARRTLIRPAHGCAAGPGPEFRAGYVPRIAAGGDWPLQHSRLDEGIPTLGGKTPRDACRTEDGRRRVVFMLRTRPKPGEVIPEDAHREILDEIREELGPAPDPA